MMVLLKAVGALDHQTSKTDYPLCTRYGLRPKAMVDVRKIRRQLIQIGRSTQQAWRSLDFFRSKFITAFEKYREERSNTLQSQTEARERRLLYQ